VRTQRTADNRLRSRLGRWLAIWALGLAAGPLCPGQPAYEIVDLGTLGGSVSRAYGVNERGLVVGEAETTGGRLHAFAWEDGQGMKDLGDLGGRVSRAYGVNDAGAVVGEAEDTNGASRAFRWSAEGGMTALEVPESIQSYAYAINGQGIVAGAAEFKDGRAAVLWSNGVGEALGGMSGRDSEAHGVNDGDAVAGSMEVPMSEAPVSRGFVFYGRSSATDVTAIEPLRTNGNSAALALNNLGQITGSCETEDGKSQVMLYEPVRGVRVLDTRKNAVSAGYGISDNGAVVGVMLSAEADDDHAFLWKDGEMYDLNELIDPDGDWIVLEARDVNEAGWIVGHGLLDGRERACLLRPLRAEKLAELPTVRISIPRPESMYREPALILVEAQASAESGLRRVVFHANGKAIGTDTESPYDVMWTNVPAGEYVLTATAVDQDGGVRRSGGVRVRVDMPAERRPPGADAPAER
jgi:probable HAF family extracellular repeat protein